MVNRSSPGPFPLALHGDLVGHRSPNEIGPGVYDIHSPRARHAARPTTAAERRPAAGGSALFEILVEINALKHRRDALFARCDVLLMPATAALPWAAEQSHPETIDRRPARPCHLYRLRQRGGAARNRDALGPCRWPADRLPVGCVRGPAQDAACALS
jgi:Asp-tRNA(Asn)/Glu-tRNA(Gln) amidotransferase A subunit family amidase